MIRWNLRNRRECKAFVCERRAPLFRLGRTTTDFCGIGAFCECAATKHVCSKWRWALCSRDRLSKFKTRANSARTITLYWEEERLFLISRKHTVPAICLKKWLYRRTRAKKKCEENGGERTQKIKACALYSSTFSPNNKHFCAHKRDNVEFLSAYQINQKLTSFCCFVGECNRDILWADRLGVALLKTN